MLDLSQIAQAIEQKRMKLNRAADKYGLSSPVVLKISQELDVLINIYNNRLTGGKLQKSTPIHYFW